MAGVKQNRVNIRTRLLIFCLAAATPGWIVALALYQSTSFDNESNSFCFVTAAFALAVGASVLLAYIATRHFTANINVLVKEALALGRGDLSKRVKVKAADELGTLARAFNYMANNLQMDQEQKRLVEKLSESIRRSLELDQILNTTVKELGRALSVSRCCLALLDLSAREDSSNQELIFKHVWYDSTAGGAPLHNRMVPLSENGILRSMIERGSIISLDVIDENGPTSLFEGEDNLPEDWKSIRSLIACPITADKKALGIILVQQCDHLRVFADTELDLVETVSKHLAVAIQHARLYKRTKAMAEQEMLINHIVRSVRNSLDLDTILNTVTKELCQALAVDRCQIAQPGLAGPLVITHEFQAEGITSAKGLNIYPENMDFNPELNGEGGGQLEHSILGIDLAKLTAPVQSVSSLSVDESVMDPGREAPIAIIHDTNSDNRTIAFKHFINQIDSKSLIAAPLLSENRLIGLLLVHQCQTPRVWKARDFQLVAAIADQLAIAVTHARLFAQVKQQAITDGLTGLYNHVYFKNRLGEEIRLATRKNTPCSLVMIDLDRLKQINDHFGHLIGDAAIRQVSSILKAILRSGDTAARYGGEEFSIILPETTLLEAALIADRLCTHIAQTQVAGLGKITASIGIASFPQQANDVNDLIEKADSALYCAKRGGRNQIWIYQNAGQSVPEFRVARRFLALTKKEDLEEAVAFDRNV
jgi:diguanylate cyclase (GGDEF)-like protein